MTRLKACGLLVKHRIHEDTLIVDLGSLHRVLSSAPRGGGFVRARTILNHQVPANPADRRNDRPITPTTRQWADPARYLGRLAFRVKAASPTVGLMTAVPMRQLVRNREESEGMWIECFCTVGVSNAVRAGEPVCHTGIGRSSRNQPGTINIILVTNATLTVPAMVGAVQVATESKTATLIEEHVLSSLSQVPATGTGTDAVVIASSLAGRYRVQYSGTHTVIGSMIGSLVTRSVREGLHRSSRWHKDTLR